VTWQAELSQRKARVEFHKKNASRREDARERQQERKKTCNEAHGMFIEERSDLENQGEKEVQAYSNAALSTCQMHRRVRARRLGVETIGNMRIP
jgi:hypothetical protein